MEHIKFEKVVIKKSEFFDWLTSTLEDSGWVRVETNHSAEGWVYKSTGSDGKQEILINFRNGCNGHNNDYAFTTTSNIYIDIRPLLSYTPNETEGKTGIHVPAIADSYYTRWSLGQYTGSYNMNVDIPLIIHYNCSKNRIVFTVTHRANTVFMMFGKPNKNYAKDYADTGTMLFTTYNYRFNNVITTNIADRPSKALSTMDIVTNPITNGVARNQLIMCEVGFGSVLEGMKGLLEGIYFIKIGGKSGLNAYHEGDKYIDESGNEYSLLCHRATNSSDYKNTLGEGYLAICTKLAGED